MEITVSNLTNIIQQLFARGYLTYQVYISFRVSWSPWSSYGCYTTGNLEDSQNETSSRPVAMVSLGICGPREDARCPTRERGWHQSRRPDLVEPTLESAVQCLREIADMGRKAGSETAKNWLIVHGLAREPGGYVPGKGFEETPTDPGDRSDAFRND